VSAAAEIADLPPEKARNAAKELLDAMGKPKRKPPGEPRRTAKEWMEEAQAKREAKAPALNSLSWAKATTDEQKKFVNDVDIKNLSCLACGWPPQICGGGFERGVKLFPRRIVVRNPRHILI